MDVGFPPQAVICTRGALTRTPRFAASPLARIRSLSADVTSVSSCAAGRGWFARHSCECRRQRCHFRYRNSACSGRLQWIDGTDEHARSMTSLGLTANEAKMRLVPPPEEGSVSDQCRSIRATGNRPSCQRSQQRLNRHRSRCRGRARTPAHPQAPGAPLSSRVGRTLTFACGATLGFVGEPHLPSVIARATTRVNLPRSQPVYQWRECDNASQPGWWPRARCGCAGLSMQHDPMSDRPALLAGQRSNPRA